MVTLVTKLVPQQGKISILRKVRYVTHLTCLSCPRIVTVQPCIIHCRVGLNSGWLIALFKGAYIWFHAMS